MQWQWQFPEANERPLRKGIPGKHPERVMENQWGIFWSFRKAGKLKEKQGRGILGISEKKGKAEGKIEGKGRGYMFGISENRKS